MQTDMLADCAANDAVHLDLIARLAALDLPSPSAKADVPISFARWISAESIDEDELDQMLARSRPNARRTLNAREEALTALLLIVHPGTFPWLDVKGCEGLVDLLKEIEAVLSPCEAVMGFLHGEAAAAIAGVWRQGLPEPRSMRKRFEGVRIDLLDGETVVLPFGASVPLGPAIEAAGTDGLGLWHLRTNFTAQAAAFDAAIAARQVELMPAVKAGLIRLFEGPGQQAPAPIDYLAAFGHLLPEGMAIDVILAEIEERIACGDGFAGGPGQADWFAALAYQRGWHPKHVRPLLHLDRNWAALGDEALQASLTAMEQVAASDRRSAVLCAFHAHRIARWMIEAGCSLADARRLRLVEERMHGLPDDAAITQVTKHLAALPLPIRSRDCIWKFFGNTTKAMWRDDLRTIVEGDVELAQGLSEFLIAFTEPEAFDDVEPLLFELLHNAAGIRFLDEISEGRAYLAAMRARSIRQRMLT